MSLLPENKPKEIDLTPRMFVIGGAAMSGKTYNACKFPNPILINTDGNCKKVTTNIVYADITGKLTYSLILFSYVLPAAFLRITCDIALIKVPNSMMHA